MTLVVREERIAMHRFSDFVPPNAPAASRPILVAVAAFPAAVVTAISLFSTSS